MFPKDRPRHLFVGCQEAERLKAGARCTSRCRKRRRRWASGRRRLRRPEKVNLTGAVSQISGDDCGQGCAQRAGSLPGRTARRGRHAVERPARRGGFALQIRGHSSVNTISTLVLIDGIEGDLDMLNPNDIESISVLKDAASASIYGSKAAAGVILVTTKPRRRT